jgi:hypothetical protein
MDQIFSGIAYELDGIYIDLCPPAILYPLFYKVGSGLNSSKGTAHESLLP